MDPVRFPSLSPSLRELGQPTGPAGAGGPGAADGLAGASGAAGAGQPASGPAAPPSFGEALEAALHSVSRVQSQSDESTRLFAMGSDIDLHTVLLQVEKADISFRTMMEVRNKLLDAYREVMRMQI